MAGRDHAPITIGNCNVAYKPVTTREKAMEQARVNAQKWQNNLASHQVTVVPVDVHVMRNGALADQYRVCCGKIAPKSTHYAALVRDIKKETRGEVVEANISKNADKEVKGSSFDVYHSQPYKSFSWKRVPLDILSGLFMLLLALAIPIAMGYFLPWVPYSSELHNLIDVWLADLIKELWRT